MRRSARLGRQAPGADVAQAAGATPSCSSSEDEVPLLALPRHASDDAPGAKRGAAAIVASVAAAFSAPDEPRRGRSVAQPAGPSSGPGGRPRATSRAAAAKTVAAPARGRAAQAREDAGERPPSQENRRRVADLLRRALAAGGGPPATAEGATAAEEPPNAAFALGSVVVTTAAAMLRSADELTSAPLGELAPGTRCTVLARGAASPGRRLGVRCEQGQEGWLSCVNSKGNALLVPAPQPQGLDEKGKTVTVSATQAYASPARRIREKKTLGAADEAVKSEDAAARSPGPPAEADDRCARAAAALERALAVHAAGERDYRVRARGLTANLKQNEELRAEVLRGDVAADEVVQRHSWELAKPELREVREQELEKYFREEVSLPSQGAPDGGDAGREAGGGRGPAGPATARPPEAAGVEQPRRASAPLGANLAPLSEGGGVQIVGLAADGDRGEPLNGRRGKLESWDPGSGVCSVRLATLELKLIKASNLVAC